MDENIYVVAYEPGLETSQLPTWTDREGSVALFDSSPGEPVERVDIPEVPGAFQLLNVLSHEEADTFVDIVESLGFHKDSPVSLPHNIRHNNNANWVVSQAIDGPIWERSKTFVTEHCSDQTAKGINARFRFYRYDESDFFSPHTDGAWPGSRVIDGELVANAYPNLYSQYTYLIFLNDGYEGGRTQFMVSKSEPQQPAPQGEDVNVVSVRTPKGGVLCFPHGMHPRHCVHSGEQVASGTKYIIRTDILFG